MSAEVYRVDWARRRSTGGSGDAPLHALLHACRRRAGCGSRGRFARGAAGCTCSPAAAAARRTSARDTCGTASSGEPPACTSRCGTSRRQRALHAAAPPGAPPGLAPATRGCAVCHAYICNCKHASRGPIRMIDHNQALHSRDLRGLRSRDLRRRLCAKHVSAFRESMACVERVGRMTGRPRVKGAACTR